MDQISDWKISKWPFLAANAVLLAVAAGVVCKAAHPIAQAEILAATGCSADAWRFPVPSGATLMVRSALRVLIRSARSATVGVSAPGTEAAPERPALS